MREGRKRERGKKEGEMEGWEKEGEMEGGEKEGEMERGEKEGEMEGWEKEGEMEGREKRRERDKKMGKMKGGQYNVYNYGNIITIKIRHMIQISATPGIN